MKLVKNNDLTVTLYLYLFNKIPYFKLKKKINTKTAFKNFYSKKISQSLKTNNNYKEITKKLKFQIEKFKLLANVGFLSINVTNSIVFLLLNAVSITLGYLNNKDIVKYNDIKYKISPSYNKDLLEIDFKCLINIKIIDVIYVLLLLLNCSYKNRKL